MLLFNYAIRCLQKLDNNHFKIEQVKTTPIKTFKQTRQWTMVGFIYITDTYIHWIYFFPCAPCRCSVRMKSWQKNIQINSHWIENFEVTLSLRVKFKNSNCIKGFKHCYILMNASIIVNFIVFMVLFNTHGDPVVYKLKCVECYLILTSTQ